MGISKDARARLFSCHNVGEKSDVWICRQAIPAAVARSVEDYFVNALGTDGGLGGGDSSADYVYAYRKIPQTNS